MRRSRDRLSTFVVLLSIGAAALLGPGAGAAEAVLLQAAPTWPVPADALAGPPPSAQMPTAIDAPPAPEEIADPVTPAAACGDWYAQSSYGARWPAASTWWEYRCTYVSSEYHNTCPGPACNAFCPSCWWQTDEWTDYFAWDGSSVVFYGELFYSSYEYDDGWAGWSAYWWDAATAQWYDAEPWYFNGPDALSVSTDGAGAGEVTSTPAGITCGDRCVASFAAGTAVTLTASPDADSIFVGWSGACSGTGSCDLTMSGARSVTATFAVKAFELAVAKAGSGSGDVTSTPAGIACGVTCTASFFTGTGVTLTASSDASSIFTGWSGACSGTGICQIMMAAPQSVTATFSPIVYRADASIGLSPTAAWTGDDVYSRTGIGQTASTSVARRATATFSIAAQNDGNVPDGLTVNGTGTAKGFSVHYYDGAVDVTPAVVQGTYTTGALAPGAARVLTMTVTVAANVRPGTAASWLVAVASHGVEDGVNALVTVA